MKKNKPYTLAALLVLVCITVDLQQAVASPFERSGRSFMKKDRDHKKLIGMTAGLGKIETDESEQGVMAYANLFMFWFNFSIEHHNFDTRRVTNTYTGVGLGRYFQIQYGYSNKDYIIRARTELEVIGNMTVFAARERYRNNPQYDNYSVGIGYNF